MLRRWWNHPQIALRLTTGLICFAGLIAGLGTFLRDRTADQNDQWTFLLDTSGLLLAVIAAALDFRASGRIAEFSPGTGRRRAILQVALGIIVGLGACVILGWVEADTRSPYVRGLLSAGLTAAIGTALAGFLYIGWFSGAERMGRRIEQRIDEDW